MQSVPVKLAHDTISLGELESLGGWIATNPQLTKGPQTVEFESKFADMVGSKFAVFVNSGSSANLLAASAILQSDRLRNRRALCPAVSWVTTVTPFLQLGFDVRLVEADSKTLGLDVASLEQEIKKFDPSVLILVHVLGHANDMVRIRELCDQYDVIVIEDTCEALGTTIAGNNWLGTQGEIGTFSFYYGHHISTIEGGMAVTDDAELHQLMLSIRSHGWSRDLPEEARATLQTDWAVDDFSNLYTFYHQGFNLRPTDIQARLGISQLGRLPEIIAARQDNFYRYREGLPDFWSQDSDVEVISSFAYGTLLRNRGEVAAALSRDGIESRPLLCGNLGRHPFWTRRKQEFRGVVADAVHDFGIYFPNHANLGASQIDQVCRIVRDIGVPEQIA